jgi:hypothetical protein
MTGAVLLIGPAVECYTILRIGRLLTLHVFSACCSSARSSFTRAWACRTRVPRLRYPCGVRTWSSLTRGKSRMGSRGLFGSNAAHVVDFAATLEHETGGNTLVPG